MSINLNSNIYSLPSGVVKAEPAVNETSCHQRNGQLEPNKRNNRISVSLITENR